MQISILIIRVTSVGRVVLLRVGRLEPSRVLPRSRGLKGACAVVIQACDNYHVVRQVLVDGVDVALHHGGRRRLSPAGIAIAVAHFAELSFPVRVR